MAAGFAGQLHQFLQLACIRHLAHGLGVGDKQAAQGKGGTGHPLAERDIGKHLMGQQGGGLGHAAGAAAGAESALLAGKYHQPLEVAFVAAHPEKAVFEAAALQVGFEHPVNMAEHVRPTRIVIEDALKEGDHSVLEYNTMTIKDLPERVFTQQYLRRL
tara:strand:+ start:238 stop:714 length:477 start_codon:yes stop_codon:yes gene_type:complete